MAGNAATSVHGSYRSVEETDRAIDIVGPALEQFAPSSIHWFLVDQFRTAAALPQKFTDLANRHVCPWYVEVVFNPDSAIITAGEVAITSDSSILDQVER